MVTYRASLNVPSDLVSWLENVIAARRSEAGGSWRALPSWDQAVMLLVWLAKGETFAQLAAHFGVATDTELLPTWLAGCPVGLTNGRSPW